ncbi:MAG: NADH-quinone oxidoreductase subunit A [Candidatus Odinarchaeia archaeon]
MLDLIWIPIGFLIVFIAVVVLWAWGKHVAPPSREEGEAVTTYACGEDQPILSTQFRINWFYYAVYFMIFDIIAFILAMGAFTLGTYPAVLATVAYGVVSIVALVMLVRR